MISKAASPLAGKGDAAQEHETRGSSAKNGFSKIGERQLRGKAKSHIARCHLLNPFLSYKALAVPRLAAVTMICHKVAFILF